MKFSSAERLNLVSFQLVHQTQQRIRYFIPRLASDAGYVIRLQEHAGSVPGVNQVRINQAARSLVVEYDSVLASSAFMRDQMSDLIQQAGSDRDARQDGFDAVTAEPLVEAFLPLAHVVGYDVIHANSWRMRIRIPRLSNDESYACKLEYLVQRLEGVQTVRINRIVASLVVEYIAPANVSAIATRRLRLMEAMQQAAFAELDTAAIEAEVEPAETEINYGDRLGLPAVGLLLSVGALLELPFPGLVTGAIIFTAAMPVFKRAWAALADDRQFTIDFLDGLAISLHTLQGTFFGATLMLGLIEGGEVIRDLTARGSERASLDLLDCLGTSAYVERGGQEIQIPVKEIVVGDRVIVYPGDQIPVDGVILRGTALVDQCKLTGESVPVVRTEHDEVFASTLVVEGQLCIAAERTGNSTRAGVIVKLMQSAPVHDTRVENYAAAVANQMVVPTLFTAAAVGVVSGDLNRAISLLTLDLGTGIRVSVPTTILSALTYAARNGVFIRSGRAIEVLAKVDTIVFDKTGTLTQGHAGITGIRLTQPGIDEPELLRLAATAEQGLTHPVADAIVRHAKLQGIALGTCEAWEYCVGLGVVAQIEGRSVLVGSHRLMAREQICLDAVNRNASDSLVYVAVDRQLFGVILYRDPLRPESQQVLRSLHSQGIATYMLSGDVARVARSVAAELGMNPDRVYAEAFPERKVEVVRALHESGKNVAFCGDGINDSAALAYADVSISFAGATDIARETADIVLMENDLRSLTQAIQIAKQAMGIVEQNIALVAIPNISAVVAGVFFALDPVLAILINNGSAILAELNGLRPLMGPTDIGLFGRGVDALRLQPTEVQATEVQATEVQLAKAERSPEPSPNLTDTSSNGSHEAAEQTTDRTNGYPPMPSAPVPELNGSDWKTDTAKPIGVETVKIPTDQDANEIPFPISPLKQCDLAKRMGVASQTLSRRKLQAEFAVWSRCKDPDGIAWSYHPSSQLFHPVEPPDAVVQSLNSRFNEDRAVTNGSANLSYG